MWVNLKIPHEEYYKSCARIRGICTSALMRRVIETIGQDQLVASVLDDDGVRVKHKGEYRFRETPCRTT